MARWRAPYARFIQSALRRTRDACDLMPRATKTTSTAPTAQRSSKRQNEGSPDIDPAAKAAELAASLSYNEARTALELALAELQSSELDVEAMTGLYQRAQAYANRCQTLLEAVEQEILLWDTSNPSSTPQPFQP